MHTPELKAGAQFPRAIQGQEQYSDHHQKEDGDRMSSLVDGHGSGGASCGETKLRSNERLATHSSSTVVGTYLAQLSDDEGQDDDVDELDQLSDNGDSILTRQYNMPWTDLHIESIAFLDSGFPRREFCTPGVDSVSIWGSTDVSDQDETLFMESDCFSERKYCSCFSERKYCSGGPVSATSDDERLVRV
eukprot:TRINITY_DN8872_c0_g1_i1.p1 TRINITY_DN8872_c0_g1~~TRINITY_DN8872_c0_g1_i1.p1  ORF type:complete len:212 (-),score=28.21 TRINITY_DN8872_c0_g1_i1:146-715(-)